MKTVLFCVVPFLLVSSAIAQTPRRTNSDRASIERYIRESEAQWAESVASGDTTAIQRILADDFIGTDPKGNLYDKAQMIADTKNAPKYWNRHARDDAKMTTLCRET